MLQDRYENDKVFEEILKLVPEMDPVLVKIDACLGDEKLFQWVREDLSKRRPKTLITGRPSAPVEVVLRMLVLKRLYHLSYEDMERRVRDSLTLRQFCRVYFNQVPDDTALIRWGNLIQPETLEKFNERITQLAVELKITQGKKLRTDGTGVETNIHPPSDSWQLADSVRVLARTVKRAQKILPVAGEALEDLTQAARKTARKISETLRKRTEEAEQAVQQLYQDLIDLTEETVTQAKQTLEQLAGAREGKKQRLKDTLAVFIPLAQQVVDQTQRRVFEQEAVPAQEKVVSIFEPHSDIIVRGKETKPVEYGHKVWLDEVEGGIISHYRILEGNPSDKLQWEPSLQAHLKIFQHPPEQASADRGVYSQSNEEFAQELGVEHVILPKPGYRSKARQAHEHQDWFIAGRKWHAGVEGRISVLKRAHGLGKCLNHSETGFHRWVGWGVIAGNLAVIGRT